MDKRDVESLLLEVVKKNLKRLSNESDNGPLNGDQLAALDLMSTIVSRIYQ